MRHSAKKIRAGEYEYRGYILEQMYTWEDKPSHWNIYEPSDTLIAIDSDNTLRDAKETVDIYHERGIA